jgi:histidinol-phosphate aminotransferase
MRRHAFWNSRNAAVLDAALASLEDPGLVPRQRLLLNGTKRWLCAELTKEGRRFIPSEANFVMIDVGADVTPVIAAFWERKILVGRRFPSLGSWLRVSIGTPREMKAFLNALRQVVPAAPTSG